MTDNEILKVLECCHNGTCSMCPYVNEGYCGRRMISGSLDLIKRQQAEIERLKKTNPLFEYAAKSVHQYIEDGQTYYLDFVNEEYEAEAISKKIDYLCNNQDIRAEAIKEFAERLNEKAFHDMNDGEAIVYCCDIDNLVKEMAGADNG